MRRNQSFVPCPTQQPDAVLSQTDPVSATLYPVLPATANVRIIGFMARIDFAAGAPTPLVVIVTVDGIQHIHTQNNPANAGRYYGDVWEGDAQDSQGFSGAPHIARAFMYENKLISVSARITWAVNQPTPLVCRVRWAKW